MHLYSDTIHSTVIATSAQLCQIWFDSSWSIRQFSTYSPALKSLGISTRSTISRLYGPHIPEQLCISPFLSIPVCKWFEPSPHDPSDLCHALGTGFFLHITPP